MVIVGIIVWVILCNVVGWVAEKKGRSFVGYFVLSFFLSPLIGFIVIAINGNVTEEEIAEQTERIFYCRNCGDTYSAYGNKQEICPTCNMALMGTTILAEDWRGYDSAKKQSLKQAFDSGQYALVSATSPIQSSNADELRKFKELLDEGIITQEEFDAKKKQLLNL